MSQAVEPNHPHGLEFLLRDCRNVCDFFTKKNVQDVKLAEELFTEITGLSLEKGASETEVLNQVHTCIKLNRNNFFPALLWKKFEIVISYI